jgi:methyltransferase
LKFWAIASLGTRWTYKVLVIPALPLVTTGPYTWMRHPNYVAVLGELIAMALMTHARITGPLGTLFFGWLLLRRIAAEERGMALYSGQSRR